MGHRGVGSERAGSQVGPTVLGTLGGLPKLLGMTGMQRLQGDVLAADRYSGGDGARGGIDLGADRRELVGVGPIGRGMATSFVSWDTVAPVAGSDKSSPRCLVVRGLVVQSLVVRGLVVRALISHWGS